MRDRPVIFAGLAVFLAIASFPFWFNAAARKTAAAPALQLPPPGKQCVAPPEFMKAYHMRLLDSWRDQVVRTGVRQYTSPDGKSYDMSLNRTCLAQCHQNRAEFCERCHSYVGVSTAYCWSCHNTPGNALRSAR
jgi:hypothetical protein